MQKVDCSIPFRGIYPNDFSDQTDQDIRTQCALSWKWRSVNAVSLNVGSGIRLIKPAKAYMCTQTHYKQDEDGHTALCVCRKCGSVPLSHSGLTGINLISKTIAPPIYKLYQIAMVILCRCRGGAFIRINMIYQFNYMYYRYQINLPPKNSGH